MRAFITFDELREIGKEIDRRAILEKAADIQGKNVFLSHSSDDHDLVPGVIRILEGHGARVYVDERDSELPQDDFTATADRLRTAVQTCGKFVLFVTPKTKDSSWIPWELGLGDGANSISNVALFPSAEKLYEQTWSEQEYLGLYRRVIWGNFEGKEPEWLVLKHRENTAIRLSEWISSRRL
ncbi:MAG: toll/interleukin-1 receptor domain-containing protein [Deltaproteobacteria bacterium]|nr:toll/interleukin-1 receptor domain-containing protein [Deltaproteobacteria bacterium]